MKWTWVITSVLVVAVGGWLVVGGKSRQGAGKTYTFSINYPAGDYRLAVTIVTEQTITPGDTIILQTVKLVFYMNLTIPPQSSGENYTAALRLIDCRQSHVKDGKMLLDYDSADPAKATAEPIGSILAKLPEQAFAVDFGPAGYTLDARGPEAYWDELAKNPEYAPSVVELRAQFGAKMIVAGPNISQVMIPLRPVVVGDSWVANPLGGEGALKGTATLLSVTNTPRGDLATIHLVGGLGGAAKVAGVTLEKSDFQVVAMLKVYVATGVLESCEVKNDSQMSVVTPDGPIPVEANSVITTTMTPVKK